MFTKTLLTVSLATTALISTSAFALEEVDLLIRNATVLTMDKDRTVFEQGLVAVKGKQIIAVTDGQDVENYQAKTIDDAEGDHERGNHDDELPADGKGLEARPEPVPAGHRTPWGRPRLRASNLSQAPRDATQDGVHETRGTRPPRLLGRLDGSAEARPVERRRRKLELRPRVGWV